MCLFWSFTINYHQNAINWICNIDLSYSLERKPSKDCLFLKQLQNKSAAVLIKDHLSRYPKPSSAWRTQKPEKKTNTKVRIASFKKYICHKIKKKPWQTLKKFLNYSFCKFFFTNIVFCLCLRISLTAKLIWFFFKM